MNAFDGVKVFAATMAAQRAELDTKINRWLEANASSIEIVDILVRQSSDEAFHCTSIVIFYKHRTSTPSGGTKRG